MRSEVIARLHERYERIEAAYVRALDDRDPQLVSAALARRPWRSSVLQNQTGCTEAGAAGEQRKMLMSTTT